MRRRRLRFAWLLLLAAACGSRTGLFADETTLGFDPGDDDDSGGGVRRDGGRRDGSDDDVDVLPDAVPPIDARPRQDVHRADCPEAGATLIYVITREYELFSFYPPDATFKLIGKIACPARAGATPFSMAVDRKGTALILFTDERLYRVSTLNAACVATPFVPRQSNFGLFGMGFATNEVGPTETLYVAGDERDNAASGLARIDPQTFKLTYVGDFRPNIRRSELTGTGDGRLFAFYTKGNNSPPSYVGEIETDDARVIGEERLETLDQGNGWAFAFWGGDFYMFHAPGGSSRVTKLDPRTKRVTQVATLPTVIVGAGVSTCAPQE